MVDAFTPIMQQLFELAGSGLCVRTGTGGRAMAMRKSIAHLKKLAKRKLRLFRRWRTGETLRNYILAKRRWILKKKESWSILIEKERSKLVEAVQSRDMRSLWTLIRNIVKGNTYNKHSISPEAWLKHFNRVYNIPGGRDREEWSSPCLTHVVEQLDRAISPTEVRFALLDMKSNKAPGWDGLPVEFYKRSAFLISPTLARLFNFLFENSIYPETWALSLVQPIFKKKGSLNNPDNWRGVALLPSIAKIYTKTLCCRLRRWTLSNNVISENQAGFRPGYSTIDNCFILGTLVDSALAKRKGRLYCCFVDFRKAFDSVNRAALWYKLGQLGISGKFILTLMRMYSLNKFAVKILPSSRSRAIPTRTGVLQGCQLSPLLFILFINDLIDFLRDENCDAPRIASEPLHALLFADDLVLSSCSVGGLQYMLNRLKCFCDFWNLELNQEKTKVVVFKRGVKLSKLEHWSYDRSNLEVVREFKYLGLLFSNRGSWKKHILESTKTARINILQLMKLCYRCPYLPTTLLLRVYDATVKTSLLYGSEIWGVDTAAASPLSPSSSVDATSIYFYKKLLRLPLSASNVGTLLYVDRKGISISPRAEAALRSLVYWYKIIHMDETRLPRLCYLHQIEGMQARPAPSCWASGVRELLGRLGLLSFWSNAPDNLKLFRTKCSEKLEQLEYSELCSRAVLFPSLAPLRTVISITGRGAPIIQHEILSDPEKRRWFIMILLSCPGALVRRRVGLTFCSLCNEPVNEVFSHLIAFCVITQRCFRRSRNIEELVRNIQTDPESATPTMLYWLFLSADRFRVQRDIVELFLAVRLLL